MYASYGVQVSVCSETTIKRPEEFPKPFGSTGLTSTQKSYRTSVSVSVWRPVGVIITKK